MKISYLRFLMEDILRLAKEKNNPTIGDIMRDSKVGKEDVKEAIKELEKKDLISFKGGKIILTEMGEKTAQIIYNYHKIVEDIFDHRTAHSLEHFSKEYVEEAKTLGKNAISLDKFRESEKGIIALLEIENPKILSRLMGVGITIGKKFSIIKIRKDGIILEIDGRLIILDRELEKYILGVKNESSVTWPA